MEVNMFRNGSFFIRLIFALVLIGALAWGASAIFQAGQAQGYAAGLAQAQGGSANPEVAPGAPSPVVPYYGYWPTMRPHFGFFPFFGFFLVIPFLFLLFGLLFRPWRYGPMGYGHHHGHPHGHPWGRWDYPGAPAPDQPEASQEPEK